MIFTYIHSHTKKICVLGIGFWFLPIPNTQTKNCIWYPNKFCFRYWVLIWYPYPIPILYTHSFWVSNTILGLSLGIYQGFQTVAPRNTFVPRPNFWHLAKKSKKNNRLPLHVNLMILVFFWSRYKKKIYSKFSNV